MGIDQQDLYVEKLNPANPSEYMHKGEWHAMQVERQQIAVKGSKAQTVELKYTLHGPVIYEDAGAHRAYALKWAGSEPGGAGYLAGIALARASNWDEFKRESGRFRIPSENLVYADKAGNIGWIAAGLAPVRKNWSGLFPVPGDTGEYEWSGFLPYSELPQSFNPARHYIATANHKILPEGYDKQLSYEWAAPDRYQRIVEMLSSPRKFELRDFERMQQDVISVSAIRFMHILGTASPLNGWDGSMRVDSHQALLYEQWVTALPTAVFGPELGPRASLQRTLAELEAHPNPEAIGRAYRIAQTKLTGMHVWGDLHKVYFRHPLNRDKLNRGPVSRPGDANTVNATGGPRFYQTSGASYRQIIDLSDWDRSIMTNVPGESGDPLSKHYDDLIQDWAWGQYHPMPYTRKAVEAAAEDRLVLLPAKKENKHD